MLILRDIFIVTKALAETLQKVDKDLIVCVGEVNDVIDILKERRKNAHDMRCPALMPRPKICF